MTSAHWIAVAAVTVFLVLFGIPLLTELHIWLDERHRRQRRRHDDNRDDHSHARPTA